MNYIFFFIVVMMENIPDYEWVNDVVAKLDKEKKERKGNIVKDAPKKNTK